MEESQLEAIDREEEGQGERTTRPNEYLVERHREREKEEAHRERQREQGRLHAGENEEERPFTSYYILTFSVNIVRRRFTSTVSLKR